MESLKCSKCKTYKQPEEFYNDIRNLSGKSSLCKQCQKEYKKSRNTEKHWKGLYKCNECKQKYPITHFNVFERGGRSRNCKECIEDNVKNRMFDLWYTTNKEQCDTFLKHLREVTKIHGEEDLLKKYKP